MALTSRFIFVLTLILSLTWGVQNARAQANLPKFTVLDIGELNLDTRRSGDKSYKEEIQTIGNEQMRDHLLLQNEITMLTALQNWQEQVSELERTYTDAGLAFTQPDPPRSICEQVPSNTICSNAYPDLAPKPKIVEPELAITNDSPNSASQTNVAAPVPIVRATHYEWASISCLSNTCRGVLLDTTENLRFDVETGQIIENGITVTAITPTGISLSEDGKIYKLRSSNTPSSAKSDNAMALAPAQPSTRDALADTLSAIPETDLQSVDPVEPIVIDDGSLNPPAPLGETGLF